MTMLLLLIKYINSIKENLRDNIIFIFQPAEEEISGANDLVKNGIIKKYRIDKIFGIHMFPELPEGVIATKSGNFMAMSAEIDIDILGVSAHGAKPHLGVDTIAIASSLINDFQKIISRNINPLYPAVITIGRIIGGEARNIISKNTRMEGTIRTFDEKIMDFIENRIIEILEGYEKNWGCKFKYDIRKMYPPVINDEGLFLDFTEANKNHVKVIEPQMLAEDFSYYQKEIPGLFVFLGSHSEEKGYTYGLHNSKFDFDEKVLLYGVQGFINILSHYGSLVEI
jgi:amidohydrolase